MVVFEIDNDDMVLYYQKNMNICFYLKLERRKVYQLKVISMCSYMRSGRPDIEYA